MFAGAQRPPPAVRAVAALIMAVVVSLWSLAIMGLDSFACAVGESDGSCLGSKETIPVYGRAFTLAGRPGPPC